MTAPLVLVVLLGTSPDAADDAMLIAARRALGEGALVLADTSETKTDGEALAIGARVRAHAVARVTWTGPVARVHVHVAPEPSWTDDEMRFGPDDAADERGRTVGYAIATMVQRIDEQRPPSPPAPSPPPAERSSAFELRLGGAGTIADAATSAGGRAAARLWLHPAFGLEASAGAQLGRGGAARGTSTVVGLGAGPVARRTIGPRLQLAVGGQLLVLRTSLEREAVVRSRWLGAADLVGEADVTLGPHLGVYASAGAEIAFGSTPVRVGSAEVGTFPVMRALVGLGGRYRF